MKLIVEAGSSKTDSVLIDRGETISEVFSSIGINPVSDKNYTEKLKVLTDHYKSRSDIKEVHFYGSGCIGGVVDDAVANQLRRGLTNKPESFVYSDLLGAAKASCGSDSGLACILGTGSNIGYYNGGAIEDGIRSAGYLLGDEGSAYQIGREIYIRVVRNQLDKGSIHQFLEVHALNHEELVNKLYASQNVRTYLARFSKFIENLSETDRTDILENVFGLFIKNMAQPLYLKYGLPLHFCGSIGYYFQDTLKRMLKESHIKSGNFVKSPIYGLIDYHIKY